MFLFKQFQFYYDQKYSRFSKEFTHFGCPQENDPYEVIIGFALCFIIFSKYYLQNNAKGD